MVSSLNLERCGFQPMVRNSILLLLGVLINERLVLFLRPGCSSTGVRNLVQLAMVIIVLVLAPPGLLISDYLREVETYYVLEFEDFVFGFFSFWDGPHASCVDVPLYYFGSGWWLGGGHY